MSIKVLIAAIILCMVSGNTFAQKELQIDKVRVINDGDGRFVFYINDDDDKKETLNGKHRLIDGYRSEYILAEFKDGMFNGEYQHFRFNKLKESAQYKEGRRNGVTKEYFVDGETVEKESFYKEGKPDGLFKTYHHTGKLLYEKEYKNGLEHGFDRAYDVETGKPTRDVKYINGKAENQKMQRILSDKGDYDISSNYANGLLDGGYAETYTTGQIKTKGAYKAGKKDGRWETYKADGLPDKVITYRNGLRDGESITYYTDGGVNEIINYADDKKDGISKAFYYQTGYPKEEYTYFKGKRNGPYKRYYDENNLKEDGRFENDTEVYMKTFYKDGQLESIKERKPGGTWTYLEYYHSDGRKRELGR